MLKIRITIAVVTALLLGCEQNSEPPASDGGMFVGDAVILRDAMMELYPSLDRFGQEGAVLTALDALDAVAAETNDPMTFYRAVADLAAAAKDEHVIPFPSPDYRSSRREGKMMLPFTVRWIEQQPYLAAVADPSHQNLVGARVLEFDGTPAEHVRDMLRATIPSDGLSETFALRHLQDFTPTQNENYFDLNYPIWFGERDAYALVVETANGGATSYEMDALDWEAFSAFYRARLPRAEPIEFRWLSENVAYLSVLSFHDWYYEEHGILPADRFEEVFNAVAERENAALVLDLRRNEGGGDISSLLLDHLLQQPFSEYDEVFTRFVGSPDAAKACENASEVRFDPAWAAPVDDKTFKLRDEFRGLITGALERTPRDDAFDGELVVLISGATGSAAAKVASVLRRENRASFVGEETGGAAAGATAFGYCSLALPASGVTVDIPLVRFERSMDIPYGRGVLPDIVVDAGRTLPISESDEPLQSAIGVINEAR